MTSPAGTDSGDNGNGRVTREWMRGELAIVTNRIDGMNKTLDKLVEKTDGDHDKVTVLCAKQERQETWTKAGIGGAVSAIIAAIWALIKS